MEQPAENEMEARPFLDVVSSILRKDTRLFSQTEIHVASKINEAARQSAELERFYAERLRSKVIAAKDPESPVQAMSLEWLEEFFERE